MININIVHAYEGTWPIMQPSFRLGPEKGFLMELLNISAAFQNLYIIYSYSSGMMVCRINTMNRRVFIE